MGNDTVVLDKPYEHYRTEVIDGSISFEEYEKKYGKEARKKFEDALNKIKDPSSASSLLASKAFA